MGPTSWFGNFWASPQDRIGSPVALDGQVRTVNNNNGFDTTLHWKVSGAIILALIVIFGLQAAGFRFVVSANTTAGIGR